jgi:hypothetical protein
MAIIENFLTGKDRKNLGNLECYILHGKYILKSKPLKVKDPKTPAQLAHRLRFKKVALLFKQIKNFIYAAYAGSLNGSDAHNRFISINVRNCFIPNTSSIDASFLVICDNDGSFVNNVILTSTALNTITGTFNSNAQNPEEGDDPVRAYGFCADRNKIWRFDQEATRSSGIITLTQPDISALNIAVYFECLDRVSSFNGNPKHVIKYVGTVTII